MNGALPSITDDGSECFPGLGDAIRGIFQGLIVNQSSDNTQLEPTRTVQPQITRTPVSPNAGTVMPTATLQKTATTTPTTYWEATSTDKANDAPASEGVGLAQIASGINMGGLTKWSTVGVARIDDQLHLAIGIRFTPSLDALQNIYAQATKAGIDVGNIHISPRHAELKLADIGNEPGRKFDGLIGIGNPKGPCSACRAEIFTPGRWNVRPRVIYPKRDNERDN
jgi:hypothetical protein